jgi:hypothetical protein
MKTIFHSLFAGLIGFCFFLPLISCAQKKKANATPTATQAPTASLKAKHGGVTKNSLAYGKYNCTASKYQNGSYEFIPRGSFMLEKNGNYTYSGFEKPSKGKYTVDPNGHLLFSGGYFDGGKAERTDKSNRFLLVFPSNPDNRWTCSLVEK